MMLILDLFPLYADVSDQHYNYGPKTAFCDALNLLTVGLISFNGCELYINLPTHPPTNTTGT